MGFYGFNNMHYSEIVFPYFVCENSYPKIIFRTFGQKFI